MYENYLKYKERYKNLNKVSEYSNDNDPDIIKYDDWEVDAYPEDDLPEAEIFDELADDEIAQYYKANKGKIEGYDINGDRNIDGVLMPDLGTIHLDLGRKQAVRARLYDIYEFDENKFIDIFEKRKKSKILRINDLKSFDEFSERYGILEGKDLYIKWHNVKSDYKGILFTASSQGDRIDDIAYKNFTVNNYVELENIKKDKVMIFDKLRNIQNYRAINQPFNALVVDPFVIDEEDFIRIYEKEKPNKILLIDDVKSFDLFTNEYGMPSKKNNNEININWYDVYKDFDGFYIDKDNDFIESRSETVFFQDQKYSSWYSKYNLSDQVVYLFF